MLLVLGVRDGEPSVLLTRRSSRMRVDPGVISLPGGRAEAGETSVQTALRETQEEVGLDINALEVYGILSERWSLARALVDAVVGWTDEGFDGLVELSAEVDEIIIVPLTGLREPGTHTIEETLAPAGAELLDVLTVDGHRISGLSAEFVLDLLRFLDGRPVGGVERQLAELRRHFPGPQLGADATP